MQRLPVMKKRWRKYWKKHMTENFLFCSMEMKIHFPVLLRSAICMQGKSIAWKGRKKRERVLRLFFLSGIFLDRQKSSCILIENMLQ